MDIFMGCIAPIIVVCMIIIWIWVVISMNAFEKHTREYLKETFHITDDDIDNMPDNL